MNRADKIIGILIVLFGIFVFFLSADLPSAARKAIPGPALLPQLVAGGLVFCGTLLFVSAKMRTTDQPIEFNREATRRLLGVMGITVLSAVLLSYVGFTISCLFSTFLFLVILGTRLQRAAVMAVVITLGIYVVFHYGLQVQFPTSTFW